MFQTNRIRSHCGVSFHGAATPLFALRQAGSLILTFACAVPAFAPAAVCVFAWAFARGSLCLGRGLCRGLIIGLCRGLIIQGSRCYRRPSVPISGGKPLVRTANSLFSPGTVCVFIGRGLCLYEVCRPRRGVCLCSGLIMPSPPFVSLLVFARAHYPLRGLCRGLIIQCSRYYRRASVLMSGGSSWSLPQTAHSRRSRSVSL